MTCDDVIKISRKFVRGIVVGLVLAGLAWIIFAPRLPSLPTAEPPQYLGVPEDFKRIGDAVQSEFVEPFQAVAHGVEQQENTAKNVRLYDACPVLDAGPQKAGSCVGWGGSKAQYVRACVTALKAGIPPPKSEFDPSYAYGITRVQIGNNSIPCRSDGAYPSDFVRGLKQFGFVYRDEVLARGFNYSGALDREWGCSGPPRDLIALGKTRDGGDAYPIRSIDEWRDAIANGYPLTVAFPWKPGRVYAGADGRSCMAFDGPNKGGHQISSLAYDGSSGKPYWLLFNSHGANWPAGAKRDDGTPPGSIWVDEKWARWIVANGELWAISDVPGFEAEELDLRVFDDLKLSMRAAGKDQ